jgi:hypothetical protein
VSAVAQYLAELDRGDFPRVAVQQSTDGRSWSVVVELGVSAPSYAEALHLARAHDRALREALADDIASLSMYEGDGSPW